MGHGCAAYTRNGTYLARTLFAAGDRVAAEDLFHEAVEYGGVLHSRYDEARARDGIARCVVDDDPAAARRHWEQALVVFRRMGVPQRCEVERRLAELAARNLTNAES